MAAMLALAIEQDIRERKLIERRMMPDLRARTLHKWLPEPSLCNTIAWMTPPVHPTAKLIKQLHFTRETVQWNDGIGTTHRLWITGPSLRECFLDDDLRHVLVPMISLMYEWSIGGPIST